MLTEKLVELEREHAELAAQLAKPETYGDPAESARLSRRFHELDRLMALWSRSKELERKVEEASLWLEDPELRPLAEAELEALKSEQQGLEGELDGLLLPEDPRDRRPAILELRAGTGGEEASLFAADLLAAYAAYCQRLHLELTATDSSPSELGRLNKAVLRLDGDHAFQAFKFESGVHRVQRVPATEAQGRIHTSTVTVAVIPEVEEGDFVLDLSEVRIDVYRSQGSGGQGVNTTGSAVRAVYRPGTADEMMVVCQDSRSQIKNRDRALSILRSRLAELSRERAEAQQRQERRSQIGAAERSEKIRTYNYPQNRVTDHRLSGESKNFPLDSVMAGGFEPLVERLAEQERQQAAAALIQGEAEAG